MLKHTMLLASLLLATPVYSQNTFMEYAKYRTQVIMEDGLRVAETWSVEEWVRENRINFPTAYLLDGSKYLYQETDPHLLGEVEHDDAVETAQALMSVDHSAGNCQAAVVLDWYQSHGCRTPFYKQTGDIYEPLSCEDQGITTSYADGPKDYYIVLLSFCRNEVQTFKSDLLD